MHCSIGKFFARIREFSVLLQITVMVMRNKESPNIGAMIQPGVMETVLEGGRLHGFEQ